MKQALELAFVRSGGARLVHAMWSRRLTVLAYHRIADPDAPGFEGFRPNVSATPDAFAKQMDFVSDWFDVIPMERLLSWLEGGEPLPPRAALITFDDGYRDNLEAAHPVLKERGLPWTLFVASGHMESGAPFFWDLAAWCFRAAGRSETELNRWIAGAKDLPADERDEAATSLPGELGVAVPADGVAGLTLDWDQIRALTADGVHIGAHTATHPILSHCSDDRADREILACKERLEAELGRPVTTFAYPNGQSGDFGERERALLARAGLRAAFSLLPGPCGYSAAKADPLAIRRTLIGVGDLGPGFTTKTLGRRRLTTAAKSGLWGA